MNINQSNHVCVYVVCVAVSFVLDSSAARSVSLWIE